MRDASLDGGAGGAALADADARASVSMNLFVLLQFDQLGQGRHQHLLAPAHRLDLSRGALLDLLALLAMIAVVVETRVARLRPFLVTPPPT
jgi:hypothetical protein